MDSLKNKLCRQHYVKLIFEEKEVGWPLKERNEGLSNLFLVGNMKILKDSQKDPSELERLKYKQGKNRVVSEEEMGSYPRID